MSRVCIHGRTERQQCKKCNDMNQITIDWKTMCKERDEIINRLEDENDQLRELINGAKDIVEIWKSVSPAQTMWKVSWLTEVSKL
jgi:hypothetical protein